MHTIIRSVALSQNFFPFTENSPFVPLSQFVFDIIYDYYKKRSTKATIVSKKQTEKYVNFHDCSSIHWNNFYFDALIRLKQSLQKITVSRYFFPQ